MMGQICVFNPRKTDWNIFKRRLENYFIANDIIDEFKKRELFLKSLSRTAYKLLYDLCLPSCPEAESYEELVRFMSEDNNPQLSVLRSRYQFYTSRREYYESVQEWAVRVRKLSAHCEFEPRQYEIKFRDQFIIGFGKGSIQDRLLEEDDTLTFAKAIHIATVKTTANTNRCETYLRGRGYVDEWMQDPAVGDV